MVKSVIDLAVRRKWQTSDQKEWWYQKFAAVRRRKLVRLSEQQNHHCCYCERLTWLFDGTTKSALPLYQPDRLPGMCQSAMATLEHIIPLSQGGTEHDSNLIMACYRCNTLRSNHMTAMEFWELLRNPSQYQTFVRRGRVARMMRRNNPHGLTKHQARYDACVVKLACLFVVLPDVARVYAAWTVWIEQQVLDAIARQATADPLTPRE